ncbi:MAG: histidine kinase [Saprospiraceae bacterium]|nr:histidine kinase [Saprospiraceae bacterium]
MKMSFNRKRLSLYARIGAANLAIWLFIDLVSTPETFLKRIINNIWLLGYLMVLHFLLLEYVLPFLKWSWTRILAAPFLLFGFLMLYSFGFYGWRLAGIWLQVYFPLIEHKSVLDGVGYHFPYALFSIVFFGISKFNSDYRQLKETAQQLRVEKQEAELNFLKSQTNPHFLFNTLNNIYSLSRDKSDLAPESILRLSKILRYMLYETGSAHIAIEQEIKIISDYIALEQLRYDDSLRINFNYDIEDMKQALPPLLLIPLVENAFKHGASETRGRPFVDIHLAVRRRRLSLRITNSVETGSEDQPVRENIGLSNLRRQLELLYSDFELTLQQEESTFTVQLTINLASHA